MYMHACMHVELSTIHKGAFGGFQLTAMSWFLFFLTPLLRGRESVLDILRGSSLVHLRDEGHGDVIFRKVEIISDTVLKEILFELL